MIGPDAKTRGKAGRTEVYCCHKCGAISRFPRYNSASSVLRSRVGRCGEYSMLILRFFRALGYEARWVVDWSDHVWAEIRMCSGDWIHVDPCEAAIDNPLLYESWGKKQTHIVAFHPSIDSSHAGRRCTTTTPSSVVLTPPMLCFMLSIKVWGQGMWGYSERVSEKESPIK